jgi:hypothetical protein
MVLEPKDGTCTRKLIMRIPSFLFALFSMLTVSSLAAPSSGVSSTSIDANGEKVVMTDQVLTEGRIVRRFERGASLLYQSQVRATRDGFVMEVTAGHPAQLGAVSIEKGILTAKDPQGKLLWTEALKSPLCLPELTAEFVRAHWNDLKVGAPAVACVVPILKAKKVAPVKFVRLPDAESGARIVELLPGSFGMRFFLSPTQLTFSADGARLLGQTGQFEATKDPAGSPSYLKGVGVVTVSREAWVWSKDRFRGASQAP